MNLRSKEDNGEAFSSYFSEKFDVVEKKERLILRNKKPKIKSIEFTYQLTIKVSFFPLLYLLDDNKVIDYEEDYAYNRDHILVKEAYITFNEKPDLTSFQENIKTTLTKNRLVDEVWTEMKIQETKIKLEGSDEEFTSEQNRN